MSGGTYDFIDEAVASLTAGGHPFILVALTPDEKDGARYSVRSGTYSDKDERMIKRIIVEHVLNDSDHD